MIDTLLNSTNRFDLYRPIILWLLDEYLAGLSNTTEIDFTHRTIWFIQDNENFLYRTNLKGHTTNSAWITDPTLSYVLMIHHKKLDKWFQPWGHSEDVDVTLQDWAMREAREETWLTHFQLKSADIFDIDVHEIPDKWNEPKHNHYDVRFWLIWDMYSLDWIDKNEIINARWFHIDELDKMELSDSIRRMLEKTKLEKIKLWC